MTHRVLAVIVVFIAVFSLDLKRPTDIDFWWHVRTGEIILKTGSVPTTDLFSYTASGQPWVVHEWLWELAMALITRYGGYATAALLSAAVVVFTYAILYRLLRNLGANELLSISAVLWAAALALPNLGVRPRELTLLFMAAYLSSLLRYREGRPAHLWMLPVLMVLWVNIHGAFALGLALLALVITSETFVWLRGDRPAPRSLWWCGAATVAAAAVNPAGPRMLLYPFGYYFKNTNPSFAVVTEFQSPNFHEPMSLVFAAGVLVFMGLGVRRGARAAFGDALLAGVFTLQALVSTRQISMSALVLAPVLVLALCDRFRWARELPTSRLPRGFLIVNWLLLVVLVLSGVAFATRPKTAKLMQLGWEPKPSDMPVEGARFIEAHDLPGPIFNAQGWGGYLIYRWYPNRPVFIDGRIDMYGPQIVNDYTQVANLQANWRDVLHKYDVRTVLMPTESALASVLRGDGEWERVFQGEIEEVYVRKQRLAGDDSVADPR